MSSVSAFARCTALVRSSSSWASPAWPSRTDGHTVRVLADRAYFVLCRTLGRLLRAGTYATVRLEQGTGGLEVRKQRSFYAPLFVWLGDPLVRLLDTGVRVLPQREWEARERHIYQSLYGTTVRVDAGTLVLPRLLGQTLASLLESPALDEP